MRRHTALVQLIHRLTAYLEVEHGIGLGLSSGSIRYEEWREMMDQHERDEPDCPVCRLVRESRDAVPL